jgi:hypothetical protein
MASSDAIFEALQHPEKYYDEPQAAVEHGRGSPEALPLARAALVGFAFESNDFGPEGWYSLFELDPVGASIAAAALALAGGCRRNIAFEALGDWNLPLAAACAPMIIMKADLRLMRPALDVLAAYDLGSAQELARSVDSRESLTIEDTRLRILRMPTVKAVPLPAIPDEVTSLLGELSHPARGRHEIESRLGDLSTATIPELVALMHALM